MLERASSCLESGGRQLIRAPKPCLRSRRMLHSHFWHHGASDLSLPIWWAASAILGPPGADVHDRAARTTTPRPHEGALLDFLYPEKTLTLLKQLSVHGPDVPEPRRRQLHGAGVRRYSTIRGLSRHDEDNVDAAAAEQDQKEAETPLKDSYEMAALKKLLHAREPRRQELAWQLYCKIPADQIAGKNEYLRSDLLAYLDDNGNPTVPDRVLQLFDKLPVAHREPPSYRAAIVAFIALRKVGPAIQILEEVRGDEYFDMLHIGMDAILRRTVFDEQWDLCLRVLRTLLREKPFINKIPTPVQIRRGNSLPEIWKDVKLSPTLLDNLQSFLHHVRVYKHELTSSRERQETLSCFVMTFVPQVMDSVLDVGNPDEPAIRRWFMKLFDDLHSLHLPTSACYEYAIKCMLVLPRYQRYTKERSYLKEQRNLWSELYRRYRQRYLDQPHPTAEARPSQELIRRLIIHHGRHGDATQIDEMVHDLRTFYPDDVVRPTLLKFLIHFHANHGDAARVHEYLGELQAHPKGKVNVDVLSLLPFVYARRADIDGTVAQFRRIQEEFGVVPDAACWNILLLAYVRADDLDGALECFQDCLEAGIEPDIYTFGPLLDFCANRGDVEAFEALFSRGKHMGVALDTDVRARSGYVQAFLNANDVEGAEAIAQGMLRSWQAGTLSGHPLTHTWNLLIQYHALRRDIASSRECYKQMVENKIPLDSWTYGSLMRALVEVNQTNAAYKILRVTMPENNLQVHALHYAIVMAGFLRERQFDLAESTYELMTKRRVPHTESSRQASIQTLGAIELAKLKKRGAKHPNYRLLRVEEALHEMLAAGAVNESVHRMPRHAKQPDTRNYGAVPQAYYGLMISLYTARGSYALCRKLFRKAEKAAPDSDKYTTSITLTTAMMEADLKAGRYAAVARFWELARASAFKLTKTFHQAVHPEPPVPEPESLLDPSILERFDDSGISPNRRHILFKASRVYIRSLLAQPDPAALQEAQRTISELLVNGFTVDNSTWNEFIQELALRGRIADAFTTCEEYLMPRFPGWRNLAPNYIRNDRQGYQWMELRHFDITKKSVLPRYKTFVILAKMYGEVKSDEQNGVGYDVDAGVWLQEILQQSAPMTIRAIESMPRTNDTMQEAYFHNPGWN